MQMIFNWLYCDNLKIEIMKKILLLIITLFLTAQTIKAQTVVLDANGVTVKWTGTTVPNPRFVQASPRGTMEWFCIVDNLSRGLIITNYSNNVPSTIAYMTPTGSSTPIPFNNIVTTLVTDMNRHSGSRVFGSNFNQDISSWDVSNIIDMTEMFYNTWYFNQPIGSWNVSNVTNMGGMFEGAGAFNQPIGNWNVSNVTKMSTMFYGAGAFNQPIGNWNVSNVTGMSCMFQVANAFNQPIGSWNVSNVTNMGGMFNYATAFNQPIGNWNVSNVNSMIAMFGNTTTFNQPIGNWDVSNVTNMEAMFLGASVFNQNIGSWNVSNVNSMITMFGANQLSTANYDALLIGWSTIEANETPLKPNVSFSGGNSNYCNGASARNSIIQNYGWTIYDGGLNCNLSTETFDAIGFKLYPNPVLSVLNVIVDYNLINQPYSIVDGLGRVVLNGHLNEVDTAINVEQLSNGVYYLKLADSNASKFIKN